MVKSNITAFCVMVIVCSCSFNVYDYSSFTNYKHRATDTYQIRTDGYYTYQFESDGILRSHWFCFFKNGFYLDCGSYSKDATTSEVYNNLTLSKKGLYKSYLWGVYLINNDTIIMENFFVDTAPKKKLLFQKYPVHIFSFCTNYKIFLTKAIIVNDTTFVEKAVSFNGIANKNNTYHFQPCINCKPDSANWLITNKKLNQQ